MARKGKSTEEIIAALREAEVRIGQGETVGKICRTLGISEQTYDPAPNVPSLIMRIRGGYGPGRTGLQTRLV